MMALETRDGEGKKRNWGTDGRALTFKQELNRQDALQRWKAKKQSAIFGATQVPSGPPALALPAPPARVNDEVNDA